MYVSHQDILLVQFLATVMCCTDLEYDILCTELVLRIPPGLCELTEGRSKAVGEIQWIR